MEVITHITQLKTMMPSEAVPMLTPMAKNLTLIPK